MVTTKQTITVERLMAEQGWTNAEMAHTLRCSRQLLWGLVHKTRRPEQPMLGRIAALLRVPPQELVDEEGRWRE